jgi:hypothetical protein
LNVWFDAHDARYPSRYLQLLSEEPVNANSVALSHYVKSFSFILMLSFLMVIACRGQARAQGPEFLPAGEAEMADLISGAWAGNVEVSALGGRLATGKPCPTSITFTGASGNYSGILPPNCTGSEVKLTFRTSDSAFSDAKVPPLPGRVFVFDSNVVVTGLAASPQAERRLASPAVRFYPGTDTLSGHVVRKHKKDRIVITFCETADETGRFQPSTKAMCSVSGTFTRK